MPTATYIPLATITLSSADSIVEFASIPNIYKDLIFIVQIAGLSGNPASSDANMTINGSGGTSVFMYGTGSSTASGTSSTILTPYGNYRNTSIIQIFDYSATDKHKTILQRTDQPTNFTWALASRWASTNAVTTVTFNSPDGGGKTFSSGSTFSLYGIAG